MHHLILQACVARNANEILTAVTLRHTANPHQDGTMVNTKSGAQFPRDDKDFKWFNKHVKDKIRSYHQAGYKIVVFT